MDKKFKEKWVKALRSGRYKQGHGFLRSANNKFCCLGVAANIAGVECSLIPGVGNYQYDFEAPYSSFSSTIPSDWQGITYDEATALMKMNDEERNNFEEIADYIEEFM